MNLLSFKVKQEDFVQPLHENDWGVRKKTAVYKGDEVKLGCRDNQSFDGET